MSRTVKSAGSKAVRSGSWLDRGLERRPAHLRGGPIGNAAERSPSGSGGGLGLVGFDNAKWASSHESGTVSAALRWCTYDPGRGNAEGEGDGQQQRSSPDLDFFRRSRHTAEVVKRFKLSSKKPQKASDCFSLPTEFSATGWLKKSKCVTSVVRSAADLCALSIRSTQNLEP